MQDSPSKTPLIPSRQFSIRWIAILTTFVALLSLVARQLVGASVANWMTFAVISLILFYSLLRYRRVFYCLSSMERKRESVRLEMQDELQDQLQAFRDRAEGQ